jgi:hypothetical protein
VLFQVLLYTWNLTNYLNLTGEQLGSYFGYALCVSDLDGDGRDDLVVGAPLFTNFTKNKEHYETGRIYIYYQDLNVSIYDLRSVFVVFPRMLVVLITRISTVHVLKILQW